VSWPDTLHFDNLKLSEGITFVSGMTQGGGVESEMCIEEVGKRVYLVQEGSGRLLGKGRL
jgi:hypothetical protein